MPMKILSRRTQLWKAKRKAAMQKEVRSIETVRSCYGHQLPQVTAVSIRNLSANLSQSPRPSGRPQEKRDRTRSQRVWTALKNRKLCSTVEAIVALSPADEGSHYVGLPDCRTSETVQTNRISKWLLIYLQRIWKRWKPNSYSVLFVQLDGMKTTLCLFHLRFHAYSYVF